MTPECMKFFRAIKEGDHNQDGAEAGEPAGYNGHIVLVWHDITYA